MAESVEIITALISALGGSAAGLSGGWFLFRAKARDDKQTLIDQLQEERDRADERADKDRKEFSTQIDTLWRDKSASREYVRMLLDHIWQRKDPPPPAPPEGYIH